MTNTTTAANMAATVELAWTERPAWTYSNGNVPTVRYDSQLVSFGIVDDKGREVATLARILVMADGKFYLTTDAHRGGKSFGAIPRGTIVDTLDAAKALAAKKVADARRRAMRTFGGG